MTEEAKIALNRLVVRNMGVKDFAYEGSEGSEEHDRESEEHDKIEQDRGNICIVINKTLVETLKVILVRAQRK